MKHFPAQRHHAKIEGMSHTRAPWRVSPVLAVIVAYAAGILTAVYTLGFICTRS